jgi:hypothetical protein
LLFIIICCVSCSLIPDTVVWLRSITFIVDPKANNGAPFVCHVVVPYSKDLKDRLVSMDAKAYFNNIGKFEKEYKDSIEVFRFDLIPGKNQENKKIDIKSYTKAQGAYLFAKYSNAGKFMENIGSSATAIIKCQQHKIEVTSNDNLKESLVNNAK